MPPHSQESPSASLDSVSVGGRVAGTLAAGTPGWDSDMEVDADPPDWQRSIDAETRRHLRPKEKQRLDVVNGASGCRAGVGTGVV